jgi:hypothetical protein
MNIATFNLKVMEQVSYETQIHLEGRGDKDKEGVQLIMRDLMQQWIEYLKKTKPQTIQREEKKEKKEEKSVDDGIPHAIYDPLDEKDDESDDDEVAPHSNLIICQYETIICHHLGASGRKKKNKNKIKLKLGIMNIDGQDYVFGHGEGDNLI